MTNLLYSVVGCLFLVVLAQGNECAFLPAVSPLTCDPTPGEPMLKPMGVAQGLNPGRVTWMHDPASTWWDGDDKTFWFNAINYTRVESMFNTSLLRLTGASSMADAWHNLFVYHNTKHGKGAKGYQPGQKIAVKVNINTDMNSFDPNNSNGLSPQYLLSLVSSLTQAGGVREEDLTIMDPSRWFTAQYWDDPHTGVHGRFPNVHFVNNPNASSEGREAAVIDKTSVMVFSDEAVPKYNETYLPTHVTQADYIIEIDNLRGHSMAGLTATGKNWFGAVFRPLPEYGDKYICGAAGWWCPRSLHPFVNVSANPMGSYNVLVDLLGHKQLSGNAMVFLVDGLYGGPCQSVVDPVKFESAPFNDHWSSSVFASQDPVALDSVLFDILRGEPNVPYAHPDRIGCVDNYLHEASQAQDPPSGTRYAPAGEPLLHSLGVHEHWNADKLYSRNLHTGDGIELIHVEV